MANPSQLVVIYCGDMSPFRITPSMGLCHHFHIPEADPSGKNKVRFSLPARKVQAIEYLMQMRGKLVRIQSFRVEEEAFWATGYLYVDVRPTIVHFETMEQWELVLV